MSKSTRMLASGSFIALASLLSATISQAGVVDGAAYLNNSAAGHAVIGFTHGAPDATFSVPSPTNPACTGAFAGDTLCFDSNASGYTLGAFLTGGGASVLTSMPGALASTFNGTVFEFTGNVTVTHGEAFQAGHDDGLQLLIGSTLVIDAPGPTSFTNTPATYTGPSGTFAFDLVYGECCGPPAELGIALPFLSRSVPEPATLALLGLGLAGIGFSRRRKTR